MPSKIKIAVLVIGVMLLWAIGIAFHTIPQLAALTQADPLFYIPVTDTKALGQSIERITKRERELLDDFAARADVDTSTFANGFIPTGYLATLPTSIQSNESFWKQPSLLTALSLLLSYRQSAQAYRHDAEKLLRIAETRAPQVGDRYLIRNIGSDTSAEVILHDLTTIKENGKQLQKEVWWRTVCLFFGLGCKTQPLSTSLDPGLPPTTPPPSLLSANALEEILHPQVRYGPYLVESTCFPTDQLWMYVYFDKDWGFLPKQADESYYIDFNAVRVASSNTAYADEYLDQGVEILAQPEGANYRCTDLRYWGDLAVLRYIDQSFPDEKVESMHDVERLFSTHASEVDFAQVLEDKLVYLPDMLDNITAFLNSYKRDAKHFSVEPLFLVGLRSSYAITFQTFSRSTWRMPKELRYVHEANLPVPGGYSTYTTLQKQ